MAIPVPGVTAELDQPVPDCRTRFVAYWSDLDQMIFPQRFAALEHPDLAARNVDLHGVGRLTYDAMTQFDLPMILATVTYASVFVVAASAAVDMAYLALDPRLRDAK